MGGQSRWASSTRDRLKTVLIDTFYATLKSGSSATLGDHDVELSDWLSFTVQRAPYGYTKAYHGTRDEVIASILADGLQRPSDSGHENPRQAGSKTGNSIYASLSEAYAS